MAQNKEPLDLISEILDGTRLEEASARVRGARGSAGIDGTSTGDFGNREDKELAALRKELRSGRYRPNPIRRALIPKLSGDMRPLGIPTVRDRVVQSAAAACLNHSLSGSFSAASYAYHPRRGPARAAARLEEISRPSDWAVVADIERFFDSVDHDIVDNLLEGLHVEVRGRSLLRRWITSPIVDRGVRVQPVRGLPQGGPISPVLANLYLTGFDRMLESKGYRHVRYADDFVVLTGSREAAQDALGTIDQWLNRNRRLELKPAKTQFTPMQNGFEFVGFHFSHAGRSIPSSSVERFHGRITEQLDNAAPDALRDVVEAHNASVNGWWAYYGNVNSRIDAQLRKLDEWRARRCEQAAPRLGIDSHLVPLLFATLVRTDRRARVDPVDYTDWPRQEAELLLEAIDGQPWNPGERAILSPAAGAFESSAALERRNRAEPLRPFLVGSGVLEVPTHGGFLGYRHGNLVVRHKRELLLECVPSELVAVQVSGGGTAISAEALIQCAEHDVPLTVCTTAGEPRVRMSAAQGRTRVRTLVRQAQTRDRRVGAEAARSIVAAKLHNQRALLLQRSKYRARPEDVREALLGAADGIRALQSLIEPSTTSQVSAYRERLMLVEARAAKLYWGAVAKLIPDHWGFGRRHQRGATDPFNILLNTGYWHLQSRVWTALEAEKLNPYLGVLHSGRKDTPALVFDLMEELRQPVVDRTVLALVGRGARITVHRDGRLALRSRRMLMEALEQRLQATASRGAAGSLSDRILRQAHDFRRSLSGQVGYCPYRMTW